MTSLIRPPHYSSFGLIPKVSLVFDFFYVCCNNFYRELFERAIHLKLSSKRMKFFFKRYLNFEEQYGNEATVLAVKEKALTYVKSVT